MRYIVSEKRILGVLGCLAGLLAFGLCLSSLRLQRDISRSVLRLHVVANSDFEEDQQAKLAVRDAVLEYVTPLLENCADASEAETVLNSRLGDIAACAEREALRLGQSGARAELVRDLFPRKDYGSFLLPAGDYLALRVTVGSGEGRNWWCVIFPGLCVPAAADAEGALAAAGMTSSAINAVTSEPEIRFWILDLFYSVRSLLS